MKIAVVGGAGFVGRHLCETLHAAGEQVYSLDIRPPVRQPWRELEWDVTGHDPLILDEGTEAVVYLAAAPWPHPFLRELFMVNAYGAIRAKEAAEWRRFILASSCQVYGEPAYAPQTEATPALPQTPYALSKTMAEVGCLQGDTIVCRFGNIYGPGQARGALIPDLLHQLSTGVKELQLQRTGEETRDFVHVTDVVNALCGLIYLSRRRHPLIVNVGSGESHTTREVAERLAGVVGASVRTDPEAPRPLRRVIWKLDITRLMNLTGWKPVVQFDAALTELARSVCTTKS